MRIYLVTGAWYNSPPGQQERQVLCARCPATVGWVMYYESADDGALLSGPLCESCAVPVQHQRPEGIATLRQARVKFERQYVHEALARAHGRVGKAAAALGMTRQGLQKLLRRTTR